MGRPTEKTDLRRSPAVIDIIGLGAISWSYVRTIDQASTLKLKAFGSRNPVAAAELADTLLFTGEVQASWRDRQWSTIHPDPNLEIGREAVSADDYARGIDLVDMVEAVRCGRALRAERELAIHVLEVLLALEMSCSTGKAIDINTRVPRQFSIATA